MKKYGMKKTLPFVLSAALAVTALSGAVDVPFTQGTPFAAATVCAAPTHAWDFSQGTGSWAYDGNYDYSGQATVAHDAAIGGSMKVSVDFSKDAAKTWSEIKLSDKAITPQTPLELKDADAFEFDLYYDASKVNGGALFKVKVYGKDAAGEEVINDAADDIGMSKAEDAEGGLKHVHVKVPFMDTFSGKLGLLQVSIAGYQLGYQGDVYLTNFKM